MDHFVTMERLPEGLTFPPDFAGRITFDADRQRLCFHGFMSKAEYDHLSDLSEDWSYRRRLEDLFRLSELTEVPPRRPIALALALLAGLLLAAILTAAWIVQQQPRIAVQSPTEHARTVAAPGLPGVGGPITSP